MPGDGFDNVGIQQIAGAAGSSFRRGRHELNSASWGQVYQN